ncbi:hypothetical protein [Pseudoalteromonas sp. T1lg21]|uniref:hypothetical protein n=1 Tax=Pseudoalteromonas sp. T1lg21 TaxID=2077095 RepID=UPI000CF682EF|nr:hypothetical protein [Pseudoalteromonas sp. T1lg21]
MLSKYLSHRFALFLLFFCFSSSASTNLLIFNRPADTPQARYVIDLMKMAYKEIGYEIHKSILIIKMHWLPQTKECLMDS